MVLTEEFIWRTDFYAYHVTNIDNIDSICKEGLKPLCGDRSKLVYDNTKGIYFFINLYNAPAWIDALYKNKDKYELELLRFNLKNRKWFISGDDEYYLIHKVKPEKIEYLRIFNNNEYLPLDFDKIIDEELIKIEWNNLNDYKVLKKV